MPAKSRQRYFPLFRRDPFSPEKEMLSIEKPDSEAAARKLIAEYSDYYNNDRFQKKLGDLSPVEYRKAIAV
jgi:transposase InsO family protein